MAYDVFISYASVDMAFTEELRNRLEKDGFKVWFDKARLAPGFNWHHEIEQGCENSRVILPVLTPRWKNSDWTKFETYGAEAVIPLVFEGSWTDVSTPPLERFQAEIIDFTSHSDEQWTKLFNAVRQLLKEPPPQKTDRINNLRYRPNDYFTGREKELIRIHEELHCNPKTVLTQGRVRVITAMGGAGKTTLARHYAEKFWRCYPQMFWVDCRVGFEPEFARIYDILFPERSNIGLKDADKAASALLELSGSSTRLLILDNAEDETSTMKWIPKTGNCHTLITSRYSAFSSSIKTIYIFVLEKEPTMEFLQKRVGRSVTGSEYKACEELAEKLGYLPLALEQAAAYIEQQGCDFGFADYVQLYDEATSDLLATGALGSTEYPDSVITTWKPTIEKLSPEARSLIRLCSFFAATPLPVKMMIEGSEILHDLAKSEKTGSATSSSSSKEFWVRSLVTQLNSYSLVRVNGQSFTVHPLLQKVEQFAVQPDMRPGLITNAIDLLLKYAPDSADLPKTWSEWNGLSPHARELHGYSRSCSPKTRISLLDALARFDFGKASYDESLKYEEEAFRIAEETFGPESEETEDRLINYGESLRATEKYDEAEKMFRRSLEWRRNHNGQNHLTVATGNNYLGLLLRMRGMNDEAEKCFQEGLDICKNIETTSGRTYVKLLLNLVYIWLKKRAPEAEQLSRTALLQAEKEFGPEDLLTIWSLECLAISLNNQSKYAEALPLQKQSVERMLSVIGPEHPESLAGQKCLSQLYGNIDDNDNEILWAEEAFKNTETAMGEIHPDTLEAAVYLAELYSKKGNFEMAEQLFLRAISGSEQDHEGLSANTSKAILGQIDLLEKTQRAEEAKPLRLRLIKQELCKTDATPLEIRQTALSCFVLGEFGLAEQLLKKNLENNFELPGTYCHLARIYILTDHLPEAQEHIDLAWQFRNEAPSYVKARILWFRIAIAYLTGKPLQNFPGQIKKILQQKDAFMDWTMQSVLNHIIPKLNEQQNAFLFTMVEVMGGKQDIERLNDFAEWRDSGPADTD